MAKKEKENKTSPLLNLIKRDQIYIILIIITLAACIYTLNQTNQAEEQCQKDINEWVQANPCVERCVNPDTPQFNLTYNIGGNINELPTKRNE